MFTLFFLENSFFDGFNSSCLDILFALAIVLGIFVINSKNPIVSVLVLIGLFVTISIILILLGYNFIGLSYILVYVGAISILFLFILMLINIRISELRNDTNNNTPLVIIIGLFYLSYFFFVPLWQNNNSLLSESNNNSLLSESNNNSLLSDSNINSLLFDSNITPAIIRENHNTINHASHNDFIENDKLFNVSITNPGLSHVTSHSWDNNLVGMKDITSLGNVLYTTYGIWLIICSIILLLAMIGAISITKKEKD